MSQPAVHWHEGMFLRPHHFMAAQRHLEDQSHRGEKFDLCYNWGLRSVEIDHGARWRTTGSSSAAVGPVPRTGRWRAIPEDGLLLPSFDP